MISVAEALERVLAGVARLPAEQVGLENALGRVLAEDLEARVSHPPSAVSAMDGYAVRSADVARTPAVLRRVGEAPAGGAFEGTVGPDEAVRIFTGAPMPAGADCVVIQENTTAEGDTVTVLEGATPGRYVRPAGMDFATGQTLLRAGQILTARHIGLAAAMNRPWLRVARRPRVAILANGDEVVNPGEPIGPNQIVSSNGHALGAFVAACGGIPVNLGIAPDSREALAAMVAGARGADLLVTTGGASVGDYDLVREVIDENLAFYKVAMRPGKPLMFGRLGETPVLGLPGNPVSTMVCALIFLRPAIDRMLGLKRAYETVPVTLAVALPENDRRQDYLRARLSRDADGRLLITPADRQDSSMMSRLAWADALIVRPPLAPAAVAGDVVPVLPLEGGIVSH